MNSRAWISVLLTVVETTLLAMPSREDAEKALPEAKRMLAPLHAEVRAGLTNRLALAELSLHRAEETDSQAVKLLLCKGACRIYVSEGRFEEALGVLTTLKRMIPDIQREILFNVAHCGQLDVRQKHVAAYVKYVSDAEERIRAMTKSETVAESPSATPPSAAEALDRTELFVAKDGDDRADGSSEHPLATIEQAIAVAKSGDAVRVRPGEYEVVVNIKDKWIELTAVSEDPTATVLRGRSGSAVVQTSSGSDNSVIRGFTITGGNGYSVPSGYGRDYFGGGVCALSSVTIENCIVRNNGKGVARKSACTFGGGIWVGGGASVKVVNCLVVDNFAWACGGGICSGGEMEVRDSTIVGNSTTKFFGKQAGVGIAKNSGCSLSNVIVWGNKGDQLGAFGGPYAEGTRCRIENSVVQYGARANGIRQFEPVNCSSVDPRFTDIDAETGWFVPGNPSVTAGYRSDRRATAR